MSTHFKSLAAGQPDWSTTVYAVAVVDRKEGLIVSVFTDAHEAWETLRLSYAADLPQDDPDYPEALADALEAQGLAWAITEQRITTPSTRTASAG